MIKDQSERSRRETTLEEDELIIGHVKSANDIFIIMLGIAELVLINI